MLERPFRVMLVEDNDDDADLVARGLSRVDPSVSLTRASTVPSAISTLAAQRATGQLPDLVLVDGRIAGVDACDFFAYLSKQDIEDLPIVVLTGTVELRSSAKYLELGAREVRGKPIDYGDFLDLIAEILNRYHPAS